MANIVEQITLAVVKVNSRNAHMVGLQTKKHDMYKRKEKT